MAHNAHTRLDLGRAKKDARVLSSGDEWIHVESIRDGYMEKGVEDIAAMRDLYLYILSQKKPEVLRALRDFIFSPGKPSRIPTQPELDGWARTYGLVDDTGTIPLWVLKAVRSTVRLSRKSPEQAYPKIGTLVFQLEGWSHPLGRKTETRIKVETLIESRKRGKATILVPRYRDESERSEHFRRRAKRDAEELGLIQTVVIREHFEWAVDFQCGKPVSTIASNANVDRGTVYRALSSTEDEFPTGIFKQIGLAQRKDKRGRPPVL